jgi:hypothetical protein
LKFSCFRTLKKKFALSVVILMLLFTVTANAFVWIIPGIPYVLGLVGASELAGAASISVYLHGAVGAGLAWYNRDKISSTVKEWVDPEGVHRDGTVTIVDIDMSKLPPEPVVKKTPAQVNIKNQDLLLRVLKDEASKAKYPALADALTKVQVDPITKDTQITQTVTVGSLGIKTITDKQDHYGPYGNPPGTVVIPRDTMCQIFYGSIAGQPDMSTNYVLFTLQSASAPAPQPISAEKVPKALAAAFSGPVITDAQLSGIFSGEIDDFIRDNPNIMHYETGGGVNGGSTTAGTPMTDADFPKYTQAQLDAAQRTVNNYKTVMGTNATAQTAAQTANSAAASAASDLANYKAAHPGASPGNDPTLLGLQGRADSTAAAAGAAGVAAGQAAGAAGAATSGVNGDGAGTGKEEDSAAPVPASEERKTLDFSKLDALKGALASTYPFNVPASIASYYTSLVADPTAPVFDLPLPLGGNIHVDLAIFNGIAVLVRFLVGTLVSCGMMYYVVHFFRGIS